MPSWPCVTKSRVNSWSWKRESLKSRKSEARNFYSRPTKMPRNALNTSKVLLSLVIRLGQSLKEIKMITDPQIGWIWLILNLLLVELLSSRRVWVQSGNSSPRQPASSLVVNENPRKESAETTEKTMSKWGLGAGAKKHEIQVLTLNQISLCSLICSTIGLLKVLVHLMTTPAM